MKIKKSLWIALFTTVCVILAAAIFLLLQLGGHKPAKNKNVELDFDLVVYPFFISDLGQSPEAFSVLGNEIAPFDRATYSGMVFLCQVGTKKILKFFAKSPR